MRRTLPMVRALAVGVVFSTAMGLPLTARGAGEEPSGAGTGVQAGAASFLDDLLSAVRVVIGGVDELADRLRGEASGAAVPDDVPARGLVFAGLRPAAAAGPCPGGFFIDGVDGGLCTHGPDAAPAGIDVRAPRTIAELRLQARALPAAGPGFAASTAGSGTAVEAGAVPVIGDGVSGNRVLAVYAVASDRPDRYTDVAPLIASWAAHVDARMNQSAALTGGERHVRFVTDAAGNLAVARVVLSPTGDDSISNTITELRALGYDEPSRKYLVWADAGVYCGIAQIYADDRASQDNANNGRYPGYARIDAGCWGFNTSVELHELVHTLGGVQQSAPHSTPGWHCTDEYDRMCYKDSSTVTMSYVCQGSMEDLLDCGHDDYFHSNPPAGSYLATHWNVASSSFLEPGPAGSPPPPPPTNQAPTVSAGPDLTVELAAGATLNGTASDDGLPAGTLTKAWTRVSGPGSATFTSPASATTAVSFSAAGSYVLKLTADDGALTASDTVTVTVTAPAAPANTAPVVSAGPDASVVMPGPVTLAGTVSDDGLPAGSLSIGWGVASGPGTVTFTDPAAPSTTATFSAAGTYVLRLGADDGALAASDTATVTVTAPLSGPAPVTATYSDSLGRRNPTRSYTITTAGGDASAGLTGTIGGRGKKSTIPDLVLSVYDGAGRLIGQASGTGAVTWSGQGMPAGPSTFVVGGTSGTSFTLQITYSSP